ncbi:PqqD family protein [Chamaesiphon sp. VAR_48_metabat_135_sub]|uniref:PqqD family protein n=1 Tax=Chamaesiphon sp. VAR_48_metabat_135_sub TaxID=2964699 RepID=UPI00286D581D|nr:PqqD family protein [Chamaesiphon sp. VAR_48_metabat_135_sub]
MLTLKQKVAVKQDILVQNVDGELVLLNLESEEYFGLDDVGSAMWSCLKESESLQTAYDRLLDRYDVDSEQLKQDFLNLVERFVEHELVEITQA